MTTVLCYIPFAISFSLGTIAVVQLLYPNEAKVEEWSQQSRNSRLHPVVVGLLCFFPQILWLVCSLLPPRFNELTSFMLSDGRFVVYPGPLFLLLPVIPLVVARYLCGRRVPHLCEVCRPRMMCLLALLTVVCVFPVVYHWDGTATSSGVGNPWRSIHVGLKAFYYNGLWEELHYRFLLIPLFCGYFKRNMSIAMVALLFTLTHVELLATFFATWNLRALPIVGGIFLLGVATGYCFCVTRSVIPCVLLHGFSSGATSLVCGIGKLSLQQ